LNQCLSSTEPQKSLLKSLVNIISSSANVIESDRANRGEEIALFNPQSSNTACKPSEEVFEATKSLVGAANMIAATVSDPATYLKNLALGYLDQAALRTVLEAKIPDLVPVDGTGISAVELGFKTGIQKTSLFESFEIYAITLSFPKFNSRSLLIQIHRWRFNVLCLYAAIS